MKIGIILGSIREIRRGGRVAKWLMPQLEQFKDKGLEFELLDLNDYPLSFFNENDSPEGLRGNYSNDVAKAWSAKVVEMDGFIIITPEYNHGTSAVLKNALTGFTMNGYVNQRRSLAIHQIHQAASGQLNSCGKT